MKMPCLIFILFMILILPMFSCGLESLIEDENVPEVSTIFSDAENFIVNPGDTVLFWVDASDPKGKSLYYLWSMTSGEIIGSAQRDTMQWKAPLGGGEFPVRVKVSNTENSVTREEHITVISLLRPYVKVLKPEQAAFLVQYQNTTIDAQAFHDNGLLQVNLWINDTLLSSKSGNPDNSDMDYTFTWNGSAPAGITEIKISAVSKKTNIAGSDSITISLEGIIRGKKKAAP